MSAASPEPWTARLRADLGAAAAVTMLGVPQGLAYATIAGLPPAMGLYASALPAVAGSWLRSSAYVVAGPSNALSLLVGAALLRSPHDPVAVAVTLAVMVGVAQLAAGLLRLGALVDFISAPVIAGYIMGAGLLIALGQLHNLAGTTGPRGAPLTVLQGVIDALPAASGLALAVGLGTIAVIVAVRRVWPRAPWAVVALLLGIAVNATFGLHARGLRQLGDVASIPLGLPPLSLPRLELVPELWSVAAACTLLSLVESSALARSLAGRTGERVDASAEFVGQGAANLVAGFTSGYPASGSLSRSVLNQLAGARTRAAAALSGVLMLGVLLVAGPALDRTPVASLAGLLIVIAFDLLDVRRIRRTFAASRGDGWALLATMVGTWTLELDQAIGLGVGLSLVLYLQRARLLQISELTYAPDGRLHERRSTDEPEGPRPCPHVRILHVEGTLFFGAAGELRAAIDGAAAGADVRVVVVRLKRARGMDLTVTEVLREAATAMARQGKTLVLAGITAPALAVLERAGALDDIGREHVFASQARWFAALDAARVHARSLAGPACATCPLAAGAGLRAAAGGPVLATLAPPSPPAPAPPAP